MSQKDEQYFAYKYGYFGESTTVESIQAVERIVRNAIYPKVKFLSDDNAAYNRPDFTGLSQKTQSVTIC